MQSAEVEAGVNYLLAGLPANILAILDGVLVQIYETTQEAAESLKTAIPHDTKGVFLGEPVQFEDTDEEQEQEEMQIAAGAKGTVALISENLTHEEVPVVLLHELGHALDMDEADVEQLGLAVGEAARAKENAGDGSQPVQPESGA